MKDVFGEELKKGDVVVISDALDGIRGRVFEIDDVLSTQVILKGCGYHINSSTCMLKLHFGDLQLGEVNYDAVADAVVSLINSKPWSPRKEDIIAILKHVRWVR